jgi:hypothetical protein
MLFADSGQDLRHLQSDPRGFRPAIHFFSQAPLPCLRFTCQAEHSVDDGHTVSKSYVLQSLSDNLAKESGVRGFAFQDNSQRDNGSGNFLPRDLLHQHRNFERAWDTP